MKRPTELIEMLDTFPEIKLNDDDAEKIYDWINYIESRIQPVSVNKALTGDNATTQPRKTVSDAVDYYNGFWQVDDLKVLSWCDGEDRWSWGNPVGGEYKVGTREEFEAEVERRKGEEWTHRTNAGERCKIMHTDGVFSWVRYEDGGNCVIGNDAISKRKPTISKAEAWSKLMAEHENPKGKSMFSAFYDLLEQFEVK